MCSRHSQVAACLFIVTCLGLAASLQSRFISKSKTSCLPVDTVPMCSHIGYSVVTFPNLKEQDSPKEANRELNDYVGMIDSRCSNALVHLLCSVYAPFCFNLTTLEGQVTLPIPPCRNLCEYVSDGCREVVMQFGLDWPPGEHLNCSKFPEYKKGGHNLCFGPEDPSILRIPESLTTPAPVDKPCDVEVTGPNEATVTWNTDAINRGMTSGNTQAESIITCNHSLSSINKRNDSFDLTKLNTNTAYNCEVQFVRNTSNVSQAVSLCKTEFKTLSKLEIQLINDTPYTKNGSIYLSLNTNRPASSLQCQLLKTGKTIDCSNGSAEFLGLPAGFYIVRIVAENSKQDHMTLRTRVRVSTGPRHCVVNLVNQLHTIDQGNVTIWFKGSDAVEKVQCKVDSSKSVDCTSPYQLSLTKGAHKIKLIPSGSKCEKKNARTVNLEI